MKISKAAAGVVGVGLALGAVSPAFAAPQPSAAGGEMQVLDSAVKTTQDVQDLLGGAAVDPTTGELRADNPMAATAKVDQVAQGAVSMLGGLPAGQPID
ncbi:hypothetical protein ACWGH2_08215 [Streptomyces sp. NPDC054871]